MKTLYTHATRYQALEFAGEDIVKLVDQAQALFDLLRDTLDPEKTAQILFVKDIQGEAVGCGITAHYVMQRSTSPGLFNGRKSDKPDYYSITIGHSCDQICLNKMGFNQ